MRHDLWAPKRRIEEEYRRVIYRLFKGIMKRLAPLSDPFDIVRELENCAASDDLHGWARAVAMKMVTGLFTNAGRTWRQAARENMQGRLIYDYLQQEISGELGAKLLGIIDSNAELISTFPLSLAQEINRYIERESLAGRRAGDIADDIRQQFPHVAATRIALIARTETSKASTALTRARAEGLGLDWYIWRTAHDARVRRSHRMMDTVICSWRDPPAPEVLAGEKRTYGAYGPGEIFNCRCYPEPILRLDLVRWPAKVHYNGQIQMMSQHQFKGVI